MRDDDVSQIEQQVMEQNNSDAEAYQQKLHQYELRFSQEVDRQLPLSEATREELKQFQHHLDLPDEAVTHIEHRIIGKIQEQEKAYQNKLSLYEQRFIQVINLEYPPGEFARHELRNLQKSLGLREADTQQVERAASSSREVEQLLHHQEHLDHQPPEEALPQPFFLEMPPTPETAIQAPNFEVAQPAEFLEAAPFEPFSTEAAVAIEEPPQSISQLLPSEQGINYIRLNELLQASQWREADEETFAIMLKVTGREKAGWLDRTALEKFPCVDLQTINQLWTESSRGHFGFSAQSRLYHENKGDAALFGDRVGWWHKRMRIFLPYSSLRFNPQAPIGHLPALWFWKIPLVESIKAWGLGAGRSGCATDRWMLATLISRLESCSYSN